MHKIVKAVTVGSVGDLGRIARALADNGYNIAAIGGGEGHARGSEVGIISLAIEDDDADDGQIADVIRGVDLGGGRRLEAVEEHPALIVELPNMPGQLAAVAEEIGSHDINIMGVLLVDLHGATAHVGLGFDGPGARDDAKVALENAGFTVIEDHDHGGTIPS